MLPKLLIPVHRYYEGFASIQSISRELLQSGHNVTGMQQRGLPSFRAQIDAPDLPSSPSSPYLSEHISVAVEPGLSI